MRNRVAGFLFLAFSLPALITSSFAMADLRTDGWYDEGAAVADWHYRLPVVIPAGADIGSTVQIDVDFSALLTQLNIDTSAVNFDANSPRVVRPGNTLVAEQEYTDEIFAGVLDGFGNDRGQIRFILQDSPSTGNYYIYFDITQNGAKPASPSQVINGHFEHSTGNAPDRWTRTAVGTNGDENNEVNTTTLGQTINLAAGCSQNAANGLDVGPNRLGGQATGRDWHLLGFRDRCEDGGTAEQTRVSRDILVPAGAAAGVLEFYFHVQAFDGISSATNYDWFVFSVNGVAVDHTALSIANATAPVLDIDTNRLGRSGFGNNVLDFGWKRAQLNLAAFAGQTISFRVEARASGGDNSYRSWVKIDDVVWSLQTAVAGTPEGFGANISLPNDTSGAVASEFGVNQVLAIQAQIDAQASSVIADVIDENGLLVADDVLLFDDGSHGDAVANDNIWSNDGSVVAEPTFTFPTAGPFGNSWIVRVLALDASVSLAGVTDGLVHIPSNPLAPENQPNFYNIDEQIFSVLGAVVALEKELAPIFDPFSATRPKAIPGAWVQYEVRVENQGPEPLALNSVVVVDEIPPELAVCVAAACTCAGLGCTTTDPVEFDETASPILTGLSYNFGLNVTYSTDGVHFDYTPVPDDDGFDSQIRFVRVAPEGEMVQPSGADNAEFELRYVVRVE